MASKNINCPFCNGLLQLPESVAPGEINVNCPLCNREFIIQIEAIPDNPPREVKKRKKYLIPAVAGAIILLAGTAIITAMLLTGEKAASTSAPAVEAPAAKVESATAPEVEVPVQVEEKAESIEMQLGRQFSAMLAEPEPDIAKITGFLLTAPNPQVFEASFLQHFDKQFSNADDEQKFQLLQVASQLKWQSIAQRQQKFCDANEQLLHNAVEAMNAEELNSLLPLVKKLDLNNKQLVRQAEIIIEAKTIIKRGDMAELRSYIQNCPDPKIKERLNNQYNLLSHQKVTFLHRQAMQNLTRENLPEAKKIFTELKAIAPEHKLTIELEKFLTNAENAHQQMGSRNRPGMQNRRGSSNAPLHYQLMRAGMQGQREEVIRLMKNGADPHQTITISSSHNGQKSKSTVFMALIKRIKSMPSSSPRGKDCRSCLIAILESGFQPDAEEKEFIRQNLPELTEFLR